MKRDRKTLRHTGDRLQVPQAGSPPEHGPGITLRPALLGATTQSNFDRTSVPGSVSSRGNKKTGPSAGGAKQDASPGSAQPHYTPLQGQYLAFIYAYSVIHQRPPAERELQHFFAVTPPVIHQTILTLAAKGLVSRVPGQARSLCVLVPPESLPVLAKRGGA